MSQKAKFSWFMLTLLTFGVLVLFNNCQPMESASTSAASAGPAGTGGGGTGGGGGGGGSTGTPAQQYFTAEVLPLFRNGVGANNRSRCAVCHVTVPRDAVGIPASANIYNYTYVRSRVLLGPTAVNNPFYNQLRGAGHPGGEQCPSDVSGSVSPCKELVTWTLMENPLLADGVAGQVTGVSTFGRVEGWAVDPQNRDAAITIFFYVGGPVGMGGVAAGSVVANLPGSGVANGHSFSYQLPAPYRDGSARVLYSYGIAASADNYIPGGGFSYTAYTPTAAGQASFTNTVLVQMNTVQPGASRTCNSCHGWTYETAYARLVKLNELGGVGTINNNLLINKMSNTGGHSGGNHCQGGKNSNICAVTQTWWDIEF